MREYNLYDIQACEKAIAALKAFPTTCRVKAQHKSKVWELKSLIIEYCEPLNKILLGEENYELYTYKQVVSVYYHETTKEKLDGALRLAIRNLIKEVRSCIDVERQTKDGRLVPHPQRSGQWIDPRQLEG